MTLGKEVEDIRYKILRRQDLYGMRSEMLNIIHNENHSTVINLISEMPTRMPRTLTQQIPRI